jgi:hypothetical protein
LSPSSSWVFLLSSSVSCLVDDNKWSILNAILCYVCTRLRSVCVKWYSRIKTECHLRYSEGRGRVGGLSIECGLVYGRTHICTCTYPACGPIMFRVSVYLFLTLMWKSRLPHVWPEPCVAYQYIQLWLHKLPFLTLSIILVRISTAVPNVYAAAGIAAVCTSMFQLSVHLLSYLMIFFVMVYTVL